MPLVTACNGKINKLQLSGKWVLTVMFLCTCESTPKIMNDSLDRAIKSYVRKKAIIIMFHTGGVMCFHDKGYIKTRPLTLTRSLMLSMKFITNAWRNERGQFIIMSLYVFVRFFVIKMPLFIIRVNKCIPVRLRFTVLSHKCGTVSNKRRVQCE